MSSIWIVIWGFLIDDWRVGDLTVAVLATFCSMFLLFWQLKSKLIRKKRMLNKEWRHQTRLDVRWFHGFHTNFRKDFPKYFFSTDPLTMPIPSRPQKGRKLSYPVAGTMCVIARQVKQHYCIVAWRGVAMQRPWDRQIYQGRFWATVR
jgi:hypothetical protein